MNCSRARAPRRVAGGLSRTCWADRWLTSINRRPKIAHAAGIAGSRGFPAALKSGLWVATDTQFYITGWNTDLVKKADEPKSFEDLAHQNGKT